MIRSPPGSEYTTQPPTSTPTSSDSDLMSVLGQIEAGARDEASRLNAAVVIAAVSGISIEEAIRTVNRERPPTCMWARRQRRLHRHYGAPRRRLLTMSTRMVRTYALIKAAEASSREYEACGNCLSCFIRRFRAIGRKGRHQLVLGQARELVVDVSDTLINLIR